LKKRIVLPLLALLLCLAGCASIESSIMFNRIDRVKYSVFTYRSQVSYSLSVTGTGYSFHREGSESADVIDRLTRRSEVKAQVTDDGSTRSYTAYELDGYYYFNEESGKYRYKSSDAELEELKKTLYEKYERAVFLSDQIEVLDSGMTKITLTLDANLIADDVDPVLQNYLVFMNFSLQSARLQSFVYSVTIAEDYHVMQESCQGTARLTLVDGQVLDLRYDFTEDFSDFNDIITIHFPDDLDTYVDLEEYRAGVE